MRVNTEYGRWQAVTPNLKDIPRDLPRNGDSKVGSEPFKYTAKQSSNGSNIIAASSKIDGAKSTFIYRRESEAGSIDFRDRNLRVWFLPDGSMALKPITAKKPSDSSDPNSVVKLALSQLASYVGSLKEFNISAASS